MISELTNNERNCRSLAKRLVNKKEWVFCAASAELQGALKHVFGDSSDQVLKEQVLEGIVQDFL